MHGCTVHGRIGQQLQLGKKKEKEKENVKRGKRRRANALSKHSFNKQCSGYNFHKEYIGKSMVRQCSYSLLSQFKPIKIISTAENKRQRLREERCKHKNNTMMCYRRGNRSPRRKTSLPPFKR